MDKTYHRFCGAKAEALEDLTSYRADITGAREALEAMMEQQDASVRTMLWECAIIRYGRAFMSGVRGFLDKDALVNGLSSESLGTHNLIMAIRNKSVAHSVNDMEANVAVCMLQHTSNPAERAYVGSGAIHGRMLPDPSDPQRFMAIIAEVLASLSASIDGLQSEVDEELRKIPLDELYLVPELRIQGRSDPFSPTKSRIQRRKK